MDSELINERDALRPLSASNGKGGAQFVQTLFHLGLLLQTYSGPKRVCTVNLINDSIASAEVQNLGQSIPNSSPTERWSSSICSVEQPQASKLLLPKRDIFIVARATLGVSCVHFCGPPRWRRSHFALKITAPRDCVPLSRRTLGGTVFYWPIAFAQKY